jgi:hypothetical protein
MIVRVPTPPKPMFPTVRRDAEGDRRPRGSLCAQPFRIMLCSGPNGNLVMSSAPVSVRTRISCSR